MASHIAAVHLNQPGGLEQLELTELPDPGEPGPGEIRVQINATSLNYHDLAVVTGMIPTANQRIPMSDGAGIVEAVGEGVTDYQLGDHVVSTFFPGWLDGPPPVGDFSTVPGDGVDGYARTHVVAPAEHFTPTPKGYTDADSSTLPTAALTAWRALMENGSLRPGEKVLLLGTGGVSIFALQFAKAMGCEVIITSSSDTKLEHAKAMGADHVINYRKEPEWGSKVLELTGGTGVDHTIEVGGPGTLAQSIEATRIGGHIALIGILTGVAGDVPTAKLMGKQQRLQGLVVGSRQQQLDMIEFINEHQIIPVIDRTYPLEELAGAFKHQQDGQHFGKIVVGVFADDRFGRASE